MGPSKGMPESISAADGGVDGQHVVRVHLVGAEDGADDVDLVAEALGERRAQRAVDQPAGQDGLVRALALPAEERAGDLAGGVRPLLDVDGEGEEVGPLPDRAGRGGGGQQDGVADAGRATAPSASWASFPASKDMVRSVPLIGPDTEMASAMMLLVSRGHLRVWFPVVDHLAPEVTGDWQPVAEDARFCGAAATVGCRDGR